MALFLSCSRSIHPFCLFFCDRFPSFHYSVTLYLTVLRNIIFIPLFSYIFPQWSSSIFLTFAFSFSSLPSTLFPLSFPMTALCPPPRSFLVTFSQRFYRSFCLTALPLPVAAASIIIRDSDYFSSAVVRNSWHLFIGSRYLNEIAVFIDVSGFHCDFDGEAITRLLRFNGTCILLRCNNLLFWLFRFVLTIAIPAHIIELYNRETWSVIYPETLIFPCIGSTIHHSHCDFTQHRYIITIVIIYLR